MPAKRIAAVLLLCGSAAALAQVPPDIAEQTRAAGQTMDPASGQGYAALFPPSAWEGVDIQRDLAYGTDPLHTLDVYTMRGAGTNRPVLLFVHGGGFTRGDKDGAFHPDNIPLWAAKEGLVGITINYRLAPANPRPAGAQDLAAAIAWARANAERFGGDPDRNFLLGHTAGGNHVADYVGNPSVQGPELASVKGAALLSPNYFAAPGSEAHAYYGVDWDLNSRAGTVRRLTESGVPVFLADAEFDPDDMLHTAEALRSGLCATPARCPRYVHLKDHNHFTEGMALGTSDRSLADPLVQWMERLVGPWR